MISSRSHLLTCGIMSFAKTSFGIPSIVIVWIKSLSDAGRDMVVYLPEACASNHQLGIFRPRLGILESGFFWIRLLRE